MAISIVGFYRLFRCLPAVGGTAGKRAASRAFLPSISHKGGGFHTNDKSSRSETNMEIIFYAQLIFKPAKK
jgi:hypothetical protein